MSKPIKPDVVIPSEFAAEGQKSNFSEEKIRSGFNSVARDTLEGDCLNKFIDDTYKGLNYSMDGVDDLYDVTDTNANAIASHVANTSNPHSVTKAQVGLGNVNNTSDANKPISTATQTALDNKANIALDNLSTAGSNRLHALKGYLDNGTVLTDAEGLADVITYAHSTFDLSKFTVVGTPTITDDGIVSGFSSSNYLAANLNFNGAFTFTTAFKATTINSTIEIVRYNVYNRMTIASNGSVGIVANGSLSDTTEHAVALLDAGSVSTGISYLLQVKYNGSSSYTTTLTNLDANTSITRTVTLAYTMPEATYNIFRPIDGTIDLKQFSITVDGVPVFSGNKTGIDTYTIGGNTVTIPYTLSKTGSKIASANSRTDVTALYNQQGYSPYYTLDEANGNFTLPQGEIYGMMLNQSVPHVVESYQNGTSWYRVYSDGWCEQGGEILIPGASSASISFIKPYANTDYMIMLTSADFVVGATPGVSAGSQSQSGFSADYPTSEAQGNVYWECKGFIS